MRSAIVGPPVPLGGGLVCLVEVMRRFLERGTRLCGVLLLLRFRRAGSSERDPFLERREIVVPLDGGRRLLRVSRRLPDRELCVGFRQLRVELATFRGI